MDTANRATGSVRNQFMYMWKMASPGGVEPPLPP